MIRAGEWVVATQDIEFAWGIIPRGTLLRCARDTQDYHSYIHISFSWGGEERIYNCHFNHVRKL